MNLNKALKSIDFENFNFIVLFFCISEFMIYKNLTVSRNLKKLGVNFLIPILTIMVKYFHMLKSNELTMRKDDKAKAIRAFFM